MTKKRAFALLVSASEHITFVRNDYHGWINDEHQRGTCSDDELIERDEAAFKQKDEAEKMLKHAAKQYAIAVLKGS